MTDRPGMTDEQRAAFLAHFPDSFNVGGHTLAMTAVLDLLTMDGALITLDAVRDHTDCPSGCDDGTLCFGPRYHGPDCTAQHRPCPGGRPVAWTVAQ